METIRNYLETMFAGLPNTPEVLRARDELWQMMEDKYSELIAEGKSENAAIGTVISEFGNLDEIAGELGLDRARGEKLSLTKELAPERRHVSMDEAKDYLREKGGSSLLTAFGVFLCIISVTGPILFSSIFPGTRVYRLMETIGICVMMVCIAAAVGCHIEVIPCVGGQAANGSRGVADIDRGGIVVAMVEARGTVLHIPVAGRGVGVAPSQVDRVFGKASRVVVDHALTGGSIGQDDIVDGNIAVRVGTAVCRINHQGHIPAGVAVIGQVHLVGGHCVVVIQDILNGVNRHKSAHIAWIAANTHNDVKRIAVTC